MTPRRGTTRHPDHHQAIDRRGFLGLIGRGSAGLFVTVTGASALLAACGTEEGAASPGQVTSPTDSELTEARALVSDVLDFQLTSDEWAGAFGSVTFRLRQAMVDGEPIWFIRTDASHQEFAAAEGLVYVPKLKPLVSAGLTADLFQFGDDAAPGQTAVAASAPGRDDYTPAWRLHRVSWDSEPRVLTSAARIAEAEAAGELSVEASEVVINGPVVKWPGGQLPADEGDRTSYLGPGQLLAPPDTDAMTVTFKLHECFPGSRYIVTDTDLSPMAEGMKVAHSAKLDGSVEAKATGRVNVLMNGVDGPGPMGFQPSVFDSRAGDPVWSPYWEHFTYGWKDGVDARVLTTQDEIHTARDAGELDEHPGTPKTDGATFVVNCPVPVIAPNTFTG